MSYRIEQEGFEYRGYKLGQNVVYYGKPTKIIGFDDNCNILFIVVKVNDDGSKMYNNWSTSHILRGEENSSYNWATIYEIELIPTASLVENTSPSISPIHVPDILIDALNMDWTSTDNLLEIRNTIQQCIDSLNSTQE